MRIRHDLEHEPGARLPKEFAKMDIRDLIKPESTSTPEVESLSSPSLSMTQAKSNDFSFTSSISLPPLSATQLTLPSTSDLSKYRQGSAAGSPTQAIYYTQPGQHPSTTHQRTRSSGYQQTRHQQPSRWTNGYLPTKRASTPGDTRSGPPPKKQAKWTPEEDRKIIAYRGQGMKWSEISARLEPRSEIGCRLHYQNYLEKRSDWDEEKKNKLARVYERVKEDMWKLVANEMKIPWRSAEGMHWIMGETEMARRANVTPFSNTIQTSSMSNTATTVYSNANTNGNGHQQTPSYRTTSNTLVYDPEQLATLNVPLTKGPVSAFAVGEPGIKRESVSSERAQVAPSTVYTGQPDQGHNDQRSDECAEDPHNFPPRSSRTPKEMSPRTCRAMQEKGFLLPSVSDMECMVPITASAIATTIESGQREENENSSVSGRSSNGSANGRATAE